MRAVHIGIWVGNSHLTSSLQEFWNDVTWKYLLGVNDSSISVSRESINLFTQCLVNTWLDNKFIQITSLILIKTFVHSITSHLTHNILFNTLTSRDAIFCLREIMIRVHGYCMVVNIFWFLETRKWLHFHNTSQITSMVRTKFCRFLLLFMKNTNIGWRWDYDERNIDEKYLLKDRGVDFGGDSGGRSPPKFDFGGRSCLYPPQHFIQQFLITTVRCFSCLSTLQFSSCRSVFMATQVSSNIRPWRICC